MANEMNPVGWFEIYVKDMNRAKSFYETVLGTSLSKLPQSGDSLDDMWAFPMNQSAGGAAGALVKMDGVPVGPGGTIVYFVTDDCGKTAGKAKAAGGKIMKDKFSIGQYGNIALVSDPEGNIIGLHSMT
jgi:predicted enzyme related to lactoylglutathione lyase